MHLASWDKIYHLKFLWINYCFAVFTSYFIDWIMIHNKDAWKKLSLGAGYPIKPPRNKLIILYNAIIMYKDDKSI